jgi:hypothetical protein
MNENPIEPGRGRRITGNILVFLFGCVLVASAVSKFVQVPGVVTQLAGLGFDGIKLPFIATLEIASGVLLLVPKSRSIGLLLASSYLGGAIAIHVQHDQWVKAMNPAVLLFLIWFGTWLRHPQVRWSFEK